MSDDLEDFFTVPEWTVDSLIWSGYRKQFSKKDCVKSICQCHNETLNIWTHLLGILGVTIFAVTEYCKKEKVENAGKINFFLFLSGAIIQLSCSAIFHIFACHSRKLYETLHFWDLFSISFNRCIALANFYYYFETEDAKKVTAFIAIVIAECIFYFLCKSDIFRKNPTIRIVGFIIVLLICISPALAENEKRNERAILLLIPWLVYFAGAILFFIRRIPERCCQETFDIFGASHQWWHFYVQLLQLFYIFIIC